MPSSPQKIAAARANGAKSRGPASDAGKQSSARNALLHGLTARTIVLFNEPADQYQAQLSEYLDHFRPQTKPETDLVHQLAAASWRLARYAGVESGLLEKRMQDQEERIGEDLEGVPEHHRLAMAFNALARDSSSLALLNRYQARLQNDYHRVLKALTQMQSARAKQAKLPNEPNPESEHRHSEPPVSAAPTLNRHPQPSPEAPPPSPPAASSDPPYHDARSTDFDKLGRIPILKARMNADLHMSDDLKNTGKGNLFVIFGEPDIDILHGGDGKIRVKVNGVDVFHPNTGEVRSDGAEGIAC
jgi:hypothetical protein